MNKLTLILYLIIAIILLLAIKYFYCNEEFTEVTKDKTYFDIENGATFKLSTVIGGKKYYLVVNNNVNNCVKNRGVHGCSSVMGKDVTDLDCTQNTLILVNEESYKKLLDDEQTKSDVEKISCEAKYKIVCEKEKSQSEIKQEQKCEVPQDLCKTNNYDPGLFSFVVNKEKDKRLLIGTSKVNNVLTRFSVNMNKHIRNYKVVCADATSSTKDVDMFNNILFEEIVGDKLSYYLKFKIYDYYPCMSMNEYIYEKDDKFNPIINEYYFGISEKDANQKYTLTCGEAPRVALYKNDVKDDKKHLWLKFNIE